MSALLVKPSNQRSTGYSEEELSILKDPLIFKQTYWPGSLITDYQIEILQSIDKNKITVVPAGNKLGKDYISAFAAIHFFASRTPCRVVTTSVDGSQLRSVLWGEIRNFIQTARYPLPFKINDLHLRQYRPDGTVVGNSELIGRVVDQGEGLLGRHLPYGPNMEPRVLAIVDEASGFSDENYMGIDTWAHRILIIGNPFPCENFFKKLVKAGDVLSDAPHLEYDVKVIKVTADRSPNVRLSREEEKAGVPLSRRIIVPGCMDIDDYNFRKKNYDPIKLSAGLYAEFYEGEEVRMFPEEWLQKAMEAARHLGSTERMGRRTLGIDTAEGGDNTVWTVVDSLGMITQISKKTRNTALIKGQTLALMKKYNVAADDVLFDRGGGGKEHADYLRDGGYLVRSVGFGESPSRADEFVYGWQDPNDQMHLREERYAYKNKRAQMYGLLRELCNPDKTMGGLLQYCDEEQELSAEIKALSKSENSVFGIPEKYTEVFRQLRPLPLQYDGEGRMYLPPKDAPGAGPGSKTVTIKKLLGNSPDETDSLALATFALVFKETITDIGAV